MHGEEGFLLIEQQGTYVSRLKVRRQTDQVGIQQNTIEWLEQDSVSENHRFLRNLAVAGALVLCVVTLRTGAVPPLNEAADAVLTAATDHTLLDDQLGKLSFVSSLFPEAVLVFGEQPSIGEILPLDEELVTHAWSEAEPYISWEAQTLQVNAAAEGEVTGIYHGNNEERIIEITGESAYTWLYGNLGDVCVKLGETVFIGDQLGVTLQGADPVLEVRRYGESINPAHLYKR